MPAFESSQREEFNTPVNRSNVKLKHTWNISCSIFACYEDNSTVQAPTNIFLPACVLYLFFLFLFSCFFYKFKNVQQSSCFVHNLLHASHLHSVSLLFSFQNQMLSFIIAISFFILRNAGLHIISNCNANRKFGMHCACGCVEKNEKNNVYSN